MQIGIIGLGRMGTGIARRLVAAGHDVTGYDTRIDARDTYAAEGGAAVASVDELVARLPAPRTLWIMVPAAAVEDVLFGTEGIAAHLSTDDCVIDGGNSFYKDSQTRAARLAEQGVHFIDCGVSGGISGETTGFSLMAGGPTTVWPRVEPLMRALATHEEQYALVGTSGAGHFVKMIHNGIEYGIMEAIAEGFAILHASPYADTLDLARIAELWSKNSIVASRLMELTKDVLETEDLSAVAGHVAQTGEGAWTVETAKELGIDARVIAAALLVRTESADPKHQNKFSNKILAALRTQFGGHYLPHAPKEG